MLGEIEIRLSLSSIFDRINWRECPKDLFRLSIAPRPTPFHKIPALRDPSILDRFVPFEFEVTCLDVTAKINKKKVLSLPLKTILFT